MPDVKRTFMDGYHITGSVEPRLIGPYTATLTFHRFDDGDIESIAFEISVDDMVSFLSTTPRVVEQLLERRAQDIACGDCRKCSNTRMVQREHHGHMWSEHCPVCRPKIDAMLGMKGLPMKARKPTGGGKKS